MKQSFKIALFIVVMGALVVFSEQIQNEFIQTYNHCVNELASRTMKNVISTGF